MNIIIAGDGEVGFHLAKLLSGENHNITIIDPFQDLIKLIESRSDLLTISGSSTSISVLNEASISKADLLISVLRDETTNIITCVLGKKLGAKKTIARISNPEYTEFTEEQNRNIFEEAGIDAVVCPERIASKEIVRLLNQSAATEIFDFSEGQLSLFLIRLDENAKVLNKTLDQVANENKSLDFRAVAIHRNSKTIIPRGKDKFMLNDLAYVITKKEGVDDLLHLGGKEKIQIKNVIIAGGGRVGSSTAFRLERKYNTKLIEIDSNRCHELLNDLNNTLVINGDARDLDLLRDEGIENIDAYIALTASSETNILTCLHAKRLGAKKTIAMVDNIEFIDISQNLGIDTIINKKLITASYMIRYTMNAVVSSIKCLNGAEANVLEFIAKKDSPVTKYQIKDLKFPEGAIIGGIIRNEDSYIALGNFQIHENDRVVVFSLPKAINKLEHFFN